MPKWDYVLDDKPLDKKIDEDPLTVFQNKYTPQDIGGLGVASGLTLATGNPLAGSLVLFGGAGGFASSMFYHDTGGSKEALRSSQKTTDNLSPLIRESDEVLNEGEEIDDPVEAYDGVFRDLDRLDPENPMNVIQVVERDQGWEYKIEIYNHNSSQEVFQGRTLEDPSEYLEGSENISFSNFRRYCGV